MAFDPNAVADAIKERSKTVQKQPESCELLKKLGEGSLSDKEKDKLVRLRAEEDPKFLLARADAARKGLFGLTKDDALAYQIYASLALKGEPVAGYNAALYLYRSVNGKLTEETAKNILGYLFASKAIVAPDEEKKMRGVFYQQPTYLAGKIYESGLLGEKDYKTAFYYYRVSSNNRYVPGTAAYMRFLAQSYPEIDDPAIKEKIVKELYFLFGMWKWYSAEIMALGSQLYASGVFKDESDGYYANLYAAIAARMDARVAESILGKKRMMNAEVSSDKIQSDAQRIMSTRDLSSLQQSNRLDFFDTCQGS